MADIHESPTPGMMSPSLNTPGPEFPASSDSVMAAANPSYGVPDVTYGMVGDDVLAGARGGPLQESSYAHDLAAGTVAPYYPGAISPIYVGGDDDAGGRDDVASTVAGAVAAAEARFNEHQADTLLTGGAPIGDQITFPPNPIDPGDAAAVGLTLPAGAYYDPPRGY